MKKFSLNTTPIYCFSLNNNVHPNILRQQIINLRDNEDLQIKIIETENYSTALTLCYFIINVIKEPFIPFIIIGNDVNSISKKFSNFDYPDDTDAITLSISLDSNLKVLKSNDQYLFHDLNMLSINGLFVTSHKFAVHIIDICMHCVMNPSVSVITAIANDKPLFNILALKTPIFIGTHKTELCVSTTNKNEFKIIKENAKEYFRPSDKIVFVSGREDRHFCGFFTLYLHVIGVIEFCSDNNYIPIINYSGHEYRFYYQGNDFVLPDGLITNNVWDYYFEQPTNTFNNDEVKQILNMNNGMFKNYQVSVNLNQYYLSPEVGFKIDYNSKRTKKISEIIKTIKVKQYVLDQVDKFYNEHMKDKRVLAVHIRTTDKPSEIVEHRASFTIDEYVAKIKQLIDKHKLDKVFICTETVSMINNLSKEFDCIYTDCYRSNNESVSSHFQKDSRKDHHYKLGLEVLIDCLLLSRCVGLLCWKSNVSDVAIYMSDLKYEFLEYMA